MAEDGTAKGTKSLQVVRQHVDQALDELLPEGLEELAWFLDFLRFKHSAGNCRVVGQVVAWAGPGSER